MHVPSAETASVQNGPSMAFGTRLRGRAPSLLLSMGSIFHGSAQGVVCLPSCTAIHKQTTDLSTVRCFRMWRGKLPSWSRNTQLVAARSVRREWVLLRPWQGGFLFLRVA